MTKSFFIDMAALLKTVQPANKLHQLKVL